MMIKTGGKIRSLTHQKFENKSQRNLSYLKMLMELGTEFKN